MPSCAVKSCKNYTGKRGSGNVRFFRFPEDPVISEQWKIICRNETINVKNARICSVHFDASAYKQASWVQSVLGVGYTPTKSRTLREDAIPTEYVELIVNKVPDETATAQSATCTEAQSNVVEYFNDSSYSQSFDTVPDETATAQSATCTEAQSNVVGYFNDSSYSQSFYTVPDETAMAQLATCTEAQSNVVGYFNDSSYSQLFDVFPPCVYIFIFPTSVS